MSSGADLVGGEGEEGLGELLGGRVAMGVASEMVLSSCWQPQY